MTDIPKEERDRVIENAKNALLYFYNLNIPIDKIIDEFGDSFKREVNPEDNASVVTRHLPNLIKRINGSIDSLLIIKMEKRFDRKKLSGHIASLAWGLLGYAVESNQNTEITNFYSYLAYLKK